MSIQSFERLWKSFIKSDMVLRFRNHNIGERAYQRLNMTRRYVSSSYQSHKEHTLFQDVKTYCMFIGHARSGHSIIGALLDAHPNVILADEVDALQYVVAGFSREQIFHLLLARSRRQANKGRTKGGRDGKVYSYQVPGQWQGRFDRIQVVGDSKAGISTQRLAEDPALLQRLQHTLKGADVKIIHVIRNPYDNISTLMLRGGRTFDNAIERYFTNCQTLLELRSRIDSSNLLVLRQEAFIDQPEAHLAELCRFLGIDATQEYLSACASILYKSPARSRDQVQWPQQYIDIVRREIDRVDFLAGYSYDA